MIAMSGDNGSKKETHVSSMSPKRFDILPQREYYVLGSNSFAPSLISRKLLEEGRASGIRFPRVPTKCSEFYLHVL